MTSDNGEATQSFPDLDQVQSALEELILAADGLYSELIDDEGRLNAFEANPDLIMNWIPSFGRWPRDVGRGAAQIIAEAARAARGAGNRAKGPACRLTVYLLLVGGGLMLAPTVPALGSLAAAATGAVVAIAAFTGLNVPTVALVLGAVLKDPFFDTVVDALKVSANAICDEAGL